ncbi:MAG: alkaline phosphatase family protein [Candidatus Polarisedimenticolia bacterium]
MHEAIARRTASLALLGLVVVAGPATARAGTAAAPTFRGPAETVVLISIDGLRWDLPDRAGATHLQRMARDGVAAALQPPFPSNTFPAHATLATGCHPDRHGIVNNDFFDRRRGVFRMDDDPVWLLSEPLWITAERQGVRTAVYHWPFSHGSWRRSAAGRSRVFTNKTLDAEKAQTLVEWLRLPDPERPRLILSYWHGPDRAGHEEGPDGEGVLRRVRQTDALLGQVLREVSRSGRRMALVVVSDHGMAPVSREIRIDRLLAGTGGVRVHASGRTANVYCVETSSCRRAEALLRELEGASVWVRADLPTALRCDHPTRTGDLVVIAPTGAYFADGPSDRAPARGMHGDRPEVPEMRGVFRGWGAGLRRGARREVLEAIDVAPLICFLLGIAPADGIDGRLPSDLVETVRARHPPAAPGSRAPQAPAPPGPGRDEAGFP